MEEVSDPVLPDRKAALDTGHVGHLELRSRFQMNRPAAIFPVVRFNFFHPGIRIGPGTDRIQNTIQIAATIHDDYLFEGGFRAHGYATTPVPSHHGKHLRQQECVITTNGASFIRGRLAVEGVGVAGKTVLS